MELSIEPKGKREISALGQKEIGRVGIVGTKIENWEGTGEELKATSVKKGIPT